MPKAYCIFSAHFSPHLGGVEGFTLNVANQLVNRGFLVTVVTNDTEKLGVGYSFESGVEVLRLPCISIANGRLPLPSCLNQRRKLLKGLYEKSFDGVLVNTRFYPHSIMGIRFAKNCGLRPVVLDHGSAYLTFGNRILDSAEHVYEKIITGLGKRFDPAYYGVSQKSCDWLKTFGIDARGIIPNAVDAPSFRSLASGRDFRSELGIASDWTLISFVGRFVPEKGVLDLLELVASGDLSKRHVAIVFAGGGPLADDIAVHQGESCYMLGRIDKEDVSALLQQSDLFCLPSRSEGFATSLLEASACGCPSVVTDVGGARELIPNSSYGTILKETSKEALLETIDRYLHSKETIRAQSFRCMELVDHCYTWEATVSKLLDAFDYASL